MVVTVENKNQKRKAIRLEKVLRIVKDHSQNNMREILEGAKKETIILI
jgi:hypothetical protein